MFLSFLDGTAYDKLEPVMTSLRDDIIEELDSGSCLDGVFVNKTIILNFIAWLNHAGDESTFGICQVLAHVFLKFPAMWTMNWMYIRRHYGNNMVREHKLAKYVIGREAHPAGYFESDQFRKDFVEMYR